MTTLEYSVESGSSTMAPYIVEPASSDGYSYFLDMSQSGEYVTADEQTGPSAVVNKLATTHSVQNSSEVEGRFVQYDLVVAAQEDSEELREFSALMGINSTYSTTPNNPLSDSVLKFDSGSEMDKNNFELKTVRLFFVL